MVYREYFRHGLDRVTGGMERFVRGRVPGFGAGGVSDRFLPAVIGGFRVDVSEDEDGIVVVADLPGVGREDTAIGLLSPTNLWITSIRRSKWSDPGGEGKTVRSERTIGRMHRVVALPQAVTAEDGRASFNNGVLEIRLKKLEPERGARIPIESPFPEPRSAIHEPEAGTLPRDTQSGDQGDCAPSPSPRRSSESMPGTDTGRRRVKRKVDPEPDIAA